jgi:hypothetical protein
MRRRLFVTFILVALLMLALLGVVLRIARPATV